MKINEIIRERRLSLGLTQEQIANYLGVSTPAVNKWERGQSYPDITILPALARLLGTDLNTLLCFKENLTEQEIGHFANELVKIAERESIQTAFELAMNKIREYPNCDELILTVALTLDGLISMFQNDNDFVPTELAENIEKLYQRAASSKDSAISTRAQSLLVSKYMNRGELDKAESMLNELPDQPPYNKKQLQANLCMMQNQLDEAAEIIERKLLSETSDINMYLFTLTEIALKQGKNDDAAHFADVCQKFAEIFDLWEFSSYVAHFQIAAAEQDAEKCMAVLNKMIPALLAPWDVSASPLYRHIPKREHRDNMARGILSKILAALENPDEDEYAFLRKSPDFREFLDKIKSECRE